MESDVSKRTMTVFGAPVAAFAEGAGEFPNPRRASASKKPGSLVVRIGAVSVGDGWPLTGFICK